MGQQGNLLQGNRGGRLSGNGQVAYHSEGDGLRLRYIRLRAIELIKDGIKPNSALEIADQESHNRLGAFYDVRESRVLSADLKSGASLLERLAYGAVLRYSMVKSQAGSQQDAFFAMVKYLRQNGVSIAIDCHGIHFGEADVRKGKNDSNRLELTQPGIERCVLSASELCGVSVSWKDGRCYISPTAEYYALSPKPKETPNKPGKLKGKVGHEGLMALCKGIVRIGTYQEPFELALKDLRFSHDEIRTGFEKDPGRREGQNSIWFLCSQLQRNPLYYQDVKPLRVVRVEIEGHTKYISLDNRRLAAMCLAEVPDVMVRWATKEEVNQELLWRFTSPNKGTGVIVRGKETGIKIPENGL